MKTSLQYFNAAVKEKKINQCATIASLTFSFVWAYHPNFYTGALQCLNPKPRWKSSGTNATGTVIRVAGGVDRALNLVNLLFITPKVGQQVNRQMTITCKTATEET